jgi:ribosomal protein S3
MQYIVANNIARQLEGRISHRRAIKMAIASTIRMGAEGIKVQISGRLVVLKWLAQRLIKREEFLFIPSVPISTML